MFTPAEDIRESSTLRAFLEARGLESYEDLVAHSNADPEAFWKSIASHAGIRFQQEWEQFRDASAGPENMRWVTGARLNITETLLDARLDEGLAQKEALIWQGDAEGAREVWSYGELAAESARVASALAARGVKPGDAVGIYMPMVPQIAAAVLGAARLGAIVVPLFSGFAAPAIISRLNDAGAKAVLTADATTRRGKPIAMEAILAEALSEVPSVHTVISLRRFGGEAADPQRDLDWAGIVGQASADFPAQGVPSDQPLLIAYTSGTTGKPKGVVLTHFGIMTKCVADGLLCLDLRREDRHLWMSDMGWMIGPFSLFSVLLAGATLVMAEGAPAQKGDPFRLLRIAAEEGVSHLGVAPTLVRLFMSEDRAPLKALDLSALRIVPSSGEPWTEDAWLWQLEHICRNRAVPINFSGGTELFGGIVVSTVLHEIKPCGFSGESLGVGAKVLRPDGTEAARGEVGELVVTNPPPSLTPTIWQDKERYLQTYWSTFKGVWYHGDWARHDPDGTWYILGRSDDTLNIAGKRIGPAEIETALTSSGAVLDAAAVSVPDDLKGEAVACVCVAAPGVKIDADLIEKLKDIVGQEVSRPFRPREIHFVPALPKTRSMKTMRRVVRAALLGEEPGDLSSLVNPEAIEPIAALRDAG